MHDDDILGKAYDAQLMRRLLGYLRPYKARVAVALAAIIAASVLQLAQPYLVKLAIDEYIATGDFEGLNRIALAFLFILVGSFALEYLQTWTLQMTGQRIMYDLRMQIYRHLQRLDVKYYDRNPVGRMMTRVTSDVDVLNEMFTAGVVSIFGDVFTLAGIMIVLVVMDWRLALVTFTVLPLIVIVTQWFRRNVRDSYRTVRLWIARINAFLQEHITGMATVQLFRREGRSFAQFDETNQKHRDANVDSIFYYSVFYPVIEIIAAVAAALILWFGGVWSLEGTLTLGALVAFIQYSQRFFRPISDMSEKFNVLQGAMASSERIFTLLDTPVVIASPAEPASAQGATAGKATAVLNAAHRSQAGHIAFEHVWFAYNDDDFVLKDVSFEVKPGERVGIVGATGAGKSTLINLLLRFYDVTRGRITIDGVDVRAMDPAALRRMFGLVLQDVHLFSGTIVENIRLGDASVTDEAVRHAAEAVHADRFIRRLPHGYQSAVAERGATLSVGQKQLLSFARALAFDPRILLLDEATSSVDTETELLIRDALHVLMAGRTSIAIAHRLSTIQDMDQILVLHHGKLREAGSHQELLAHRGTYFKLYQLQYQEQA
ncbi:MAG: ABC transporter ATP-binding protein [Acidobacteria bacterium]|nr:ABC transporter ATP-binding protein [Acidobacteriota bacterium]MBA3885508.1 ABC transporter ATP-binding protein [Acidobacteriota bacterium]